MTTEPNSSGAEAVDPREVAMAQSPRNQTIKVMTFDVKENGFANEGGGGGNPHPNASSLHRNVSNQSTIDSGLSRNSHLDMNDPNIRR